MAAAIGVRASGDGNVTAAGTFSTVSRKPAYQGQTVTATYNAGDTDANRQLQVSDAVVNPFQEVNLLVGEMANRMAIAPRAAAQRIVDCIQAMFTQQALV